MIEPTGPFSPLESFDGPLGELVVSGPFSPETRRPFCGCYVILGEKGMLREQCSKHQQEEIEKTRSN